MTQHATFYWRCDLCGSTGSSRRKATDAPLGGWEGAELTLLLHRSVASTCPGGAADIRVSLVGPIQPLEAQRKDG